MSIKSSIYDYISHTCIGPGLLIIPGPDAVGGFLCGVAVLRSGADGFPLAAGEGGGTHGDGCLFLLCFCFGFFCLVTCFNQEAINQN